MTPSKNNKTQSKQNEELKTYWAVEVGIGIVDILVN